MSRSKKIDAHEAVASRPQLENMHPLVRDLYKRAIIVGRDYPSPNGEGLDYVRRKWKEAIRDPANYRGLIAPPLNPHEDNKNDDITDIEEENERIIRKAVGRGRYMIREMEATIQFKKYRSMRRRYGEGADVVGDTNRMLGK